MFGSNLLLTLADLTSQKSVTLQTIPSLPEGLQPSQEDELCVYEKVNTSGRFAVSSERSLLLCTGVLPQLQRVLLKTLFPSG
jgi:hypothetical protein